MNHWLPREVDAFGNKPRVRSAPRAIEATLEHVASEDLVDFLEKLAEAEERFAAYQNGEVGLEAMADGGERSQRYFLAQDTTNTWLAGRIRSELASRVSGVFGLDRNQPAYRLTRAHPSWWRRILGRFGAWLLRL